jgi:hypothetical protein
MGFQRRGYHQDRTYSQDVLSILYYLRTLDLQSQTVFPIDNYEDKKFFPLTVQVIKMEGVKVPGQVLLFSDRTRTANRKHHRT